MHASVIAIWTVDWSQVMKPIVLQLCAHCITSSPYRRGKTGFVQCSHCVRHASAAIKLGAVCFVTHADFLCCCALLRGCSCWRVSSKAGAGCLVYLWLSVNNLAHAYVVQNSVFELLPAHWGYYVFAGTCWRSSCNYLLLLAFIWCQLVDLPSCDLFICSLCQGFLLSTTVLPKAVMLAWHLDR